jgi:peptide-methionine (S)-S-oxide reductase
VRRGRAAPRPELLRVRCGGLPALFSSLVLSCLVLATAAPACAWAAQAAAVPAPAVDEAPGATHRSETAVLAGGCFWGVQAVFQHVRGVQGAVSGYAGGVLPNPDYDSVSTGRTGHAESVQVTFDPSVVSYGTILRIYFSVAHDPTQLDAQYPDSGTQYRSEIFTLNEEQRRVAQGYLRQLDGAAVFGRHIVTRVSALRAFYAAEDYHQDYATLHPDSRYIAQFDLPKLQALEQTYPQWYRRDPVLVAAVQHR